MYEILDVAGAADFGVVFCDSVDAGEDNVNEIVGVEDVEA